MDQDKFSDRGYKALFSYPEMVEALLRTVVREDFLDELDFSTLRRTAQTFVTDEFREKESDILWELTIRGQPAYIYVLIEFQSTVERFMAVRVLTYILLFYADLLKQQKSLEVLPPVFPIVLYNGDRPWTAPQTLEELIQTPFASIRKYIPRFQYYKIAVNDFSDVSPAEVDNLVKGLFLIENTDADHLQEAILRLLPVLRQQADSRLRREFSLWVNRFFQKAGVESDLDLSYANESEVNRVLDTTLAEYREKLLDQGREEGREEGSVQARQRVAHKLLAFGMSRDSVMQATELSSEQLPD